jgi:hypothetical protein
MRDRVEVIAKITVNNFRSPMLADMPEGTPDSHLRVQSLSEPILIW